MHLRIRGFQQSVKRIGPAIVGKTAVPMMPDGLAGWTEWRALLQSPWTVRGWKRLGVSSFRWDVDPSSDR